MWFSSSVVENRNGVPEALGLNPGRSDIFHHLLHLELNVKNPTWLTYRTVIEGFVDGFSYGGKVGNRDLVIYHDVMNMWFGSSVVKYRNSVPEVLHSNPAWTWYFSLLDTFGIQCEKPILLRYRVTLTEGFVDESSYGGGVCCILVHPTSRCKCIAATQSGTGIWWYIVRLINIWFDIAQR